MSDVLFEPDQYFRKMVQLGCFADMAFLFGAATHLKRDIVIVHLHASTVDNGLFNCLKVGHSAQTIQL